MTVYSSDKIQTQASQPRELQEALCNVKDQWESLRQLMNSSVAADAAEQIEMSPSRVVFPKEAPASEVTVQVAVDQESLTLPTSESLSRKVGKLRTWLRDADLLSLRACLADHSELEQDLKAQISKLEVLRTEISRRRRGVAALLRLIGHLHGAPGLLGLAERASQSLQRSWEAVVLQAAFWEHQLRRWQAYRNGAVYSLKIQTLTDEYLEWDETDFGQAFEMTFRDKSKMPDEDALSSASDLDIPSPSAGRELCAILQLSTPLSTPLPGLWLVEEENLVKDTSHSEGLPLHLKKFEDEMMHEDACCNSNNDMFSKPEGDLQIEDSGAMSPISECTAGRSTCSSSEIAFMEDEAHCLSPSQSAIASQRVDSGVAQDRCHGDLSQATLQLIRRLEQASDGERGCNDEKDEVDAQNSLSGDSSWYDDIKCNGGEELACSIAARAPKKGGLPTSCSLADDVSISMIVNTSAASILSEDDEEGGERPRERTAAMAALEEDATDVDTGSDSLSIDDPDLDGSISSESESWDDDYDDEEEESGGSGFELHTGHRWDHQCQGNLLTSQAARGTPCVTCSPARTSWADDMENGNVIDTTDSEMTQKCERSEREPQIVLKRDGPQTYIDEYSSSNVGGDSALMQEQDDIHASQVLQSLYSNVGNHSSSNEPKFNPKSNSGCKINLAACGESATSKTVNSQRTVGYFGELGVSTLGLYCALSSGDGSSCDDLSTTPLLGWEEEGRCEELSTSAPCGQPTGIMENDKEKDLDDTSRSSITICHLVVREGGTASKTGLSHRKPPPPPHPRLPPPTPPRPNMTGIPERHAKRREVSLAKEILRPIDHRPQPSRATSTPKVFSGSKTGRSYLPRPLNTSRLTSRPTMDIEVCSALLSSRPSQSLAERPQLHQTRNQNALPCPAPRQQSLMRKPTTKKPSFLPA
uniref:uncharacterized protein n=1 Tax=Myxine glutinosa TaxID=7769 RepID=UPI00358FEE55